MKPGRISLEKIAAPALGLGAILTLVCFVMMFTGGHQREMMQSYLFGYIFWISLTLGCFAMMVLYHLLRAKWVLPVLRLLEAGGGPTMLAVMGVLLLPIVIPVMQGNDILYAWANSATRHSDLVLRHKEIYLNPGGFTFRYVLYFVCWAGIAYWFRQSTAKQEKSGDQREVTKRNNLSAPAFIFFVISVTFAFTDWVMSLDGHWFSTMYGLWTGVSMAIGGFAFVVMIFCWNANREPYKSVISPALTRDIGNILFVLTMLWGYTSLSQYLILWSGNLPETNFYYVERSKAAWNIVGFMAILGQFFLPFIMLLTPRNKKIAANLGKVAFFMLAIHVIDIYQYVMPALRHNGPAPTWQDGLAFVAIGLLWVGLTGWLTQKHELLPAFDNRLVAGGQGAH
ncbi:MAG TPA: hypothetical protein VKT78_06025 [Fimbriimonadaceae bacterium]|nr:hypothetical protein [Fimbriimonadaceae bacterium]